MQIKYERFFQNPSQLSDLIAPWLCDLSNKYPNFRFNCTKVIDAIHRALIQEKNIAHEIFPGVFVTPIGDDYTIDPKLAPLKLIKIKPGAIIPLHRHQGSEYYQLLPGSELIDTKGNYNAKQACISHIDEVHAVTNINVKDTYALIALPEALRLEFLNEEKALSFLENRFRAIKPQEIYESHALFIRLLYAEALFKKDLRKAQELLSTLDLKQIYSTVQIRVVQRLQAYINQEIEETMPFKMSKL